MGRKIKQLHIEEDYMPLISSAEAKICLGCPYPECNSDKGCDYYKAEIKRIKVVKNEKKSKGFNKACVL